MLQFSKEDIKLFAHFVYYNRIMVLNNEIIFDDVYEEFLGYDFDYIAYILLLPYIKGLVKVISEEEKDEGLVIKFVYRNKECVIVLNKNRALIYKLVKLGYALEYEDNLCTLCDDFEQCEYIGRYYDCNEHRCYLEEVVPRRLILKISDIVYTYLNEFITKLKEVEHLEQVKKAEVYKNLINNIDNISKAEWHNLLNTDNESCYGAVVDEFLESDNFSKLNELPKMG